MESDESQEVSHVLQLIYTVRQEDLHTAVCGSFTQQQAEKNS